MPEDLALAGITELVKLDQEWVPYEKDTSLYIRPFVIGLDPTLASTPPTTASISSSSALWAPTTPRDWPPPTILY